MAIVPTIDETGSSLVYPDSASSTPYTANADAGDFFDTLLDIINPLQHIPLVSSLYRELTGDEIEPAARLVGGAVFGGPVGFASATANAVLEQASGRDVFGHAIDMVTGGGEEAALEAGAPAPDTTISTAAAPSPALVSDDIVWTGPRVVPSLARSDLSAENQKVEASHDAEAGTTTHLGKAATTELAGSQDGAPGHALAAPPRPAWMAEAIEVAQQVQAARTTGTAPPAASDTAQPWMANAMLEALNKYEALARDRAEAADRTDREPLSEHRSEDRP